MTPYPRAMLIDVTGVREKKECRLRIFLIICILLPCNNGNYILKINDVGMIIMISFIFTFV